MKKIVLLLGIIGLSLGMTACNSKSDPSWAYFGSLEYGAGLKNIIIASDGTKLEAETGYTPLPSPSGNLDRQFCYVYFDYHEGNLKGDGPGQTLPIRLRDLQVYPTRAISSYQESDNIGDPICDLIEVGSDTKIFTSANFLIFSPYAYYYTTTNDIPDWGFSVEVEEEIAEGEKYGTINLWLKFSIAKSDGSTEKKGPLGYINYFHAIDLNYIQDHVSGFQKTDANGDDMTYILKLNYHAYDLKDNGSYDQETVDEKSVSIEWTPNKDPYNKR